MSPCDRRPFAEISGSISFSPLWFLSRKLCPIFVCQFKGSLHSWGEALVPEAKHGFQLQQLHRIFLTINVSNKSGHLLFAQTKAPSRRMTGVSVHPVQVQDTRVLHAVSIATALLAGCSSVTGDYESSISLAALVPILLPMQRSEVTRTLCAAFCDWVTVVDFPSIFALSPVRPITNYIALFVPSPCIEIPPANLNRLFPIVINAFLTWHTQDLQVLRLRLRLCHN